MQYSGHLLYFVWTWYISYRSALVASSFQGKEFLLAFPSSFPTNSSFEQRLSIANSGDLEASINITMSKNSTVLLFQQKTLGVRQGCFGDCVNESLASSPSRLGGIIIRISSTGRIVVLAHSTSAGSEYDNYLALPSADLSLAYSTLAECPSSFCVLIVASVAMRVNITITFCMASQASTASLKYNNVTYYHGSTMTAILDPWRTLEIVTDGVNLGGSLIQSSGKVAVVSGTLTLSNGVISDFNVEAAAPREQLGTEYVVVDCPTSGTATYVKIVYNEPNTTLSIDTKMLIIQSKRDCIEIYTLKKQGAAIIRSDKSILVQLMYSEDNVIVTPTINWGTYYVTVPSPQSKVVLVTRSNCSSNFSFNGRVDSALSWAVIGDGSFKYATTSLNIYGTWLNVSAVNCTFSGTVYLSAKSTMLWSLGWGPDFVPPLSSSVITTGSATLTQTSTSSLVNDNVDTTTAASTTSSTTASTATYTSSPTSSTTASTAKTDTSSIRSSTTASTATYTSSPTSSTTASTAKTDTSSTTSSITASTATDTSSTTSSTTASTATVTSSTTVSIAKTDTSSPTSSKTASTATSSPITSSASSVRTRSTIETTPSASAKLSSATTEDVQHTATANSSSSLNTSTTSNLSTTTAQYTRPTTGVTTTTNLTVPIPDVYVCPCTCSFASLQPRIRKYLLQEESITQEVIDDLKLIAHEQLAQKMLKISMDNQSMSETFVGATICILFIAISVTVMVGPDLLRVASYIIDF